LSLVQLGREDFDFLDQVRIKSVSRVVLYILRLLILYYTSIEISVTIRITLGKNRRSLPTARGNLGGEQGTQILCCLTTTLWDIYAVKCLFRCMRGPFNWSETCLIGIR
jgi:hypothetical protein